MFVEAIVKTFTDAIACLGLLGLEPYVLGMLFVGAIGVRAIFENAIAELGWEGEIAAS